VLTVGVDLAAEPLGTAVAAIEWSNEGAAVRDLVLGASDNQIIDLMVGADKVGIDCPLGWPEPFVEFVVAHREGRLLVPDELAGRDWRRTLAYRATDAAVRRLTGLIPLSVAADRIAHPAMRCAGLLARLALNGQPVDRRGTGLVVEVYPAASLKQRDLPYRRYKGGLNAAGLAQLVEAILAAAPWLALGEFTDRCQRSDDATDAVVAALTARAAALNLTTTAPTEQSDLAGVEGWIAIPTWPLPELIP
jgi:predicted nuclease with RNAse H fold